MNAPAKIRTDFGIYVRDPKTRMYPPYEPYEPVERHPYAGWILIVCGLAAWAIVAGIGYALYLALA